MRLVKPKKSYFGMAVSNEDFIPVRSIEEIKETNIIGVFPFGDVRPEALGVMGVMLEYEKIEWLYIFYGYIEESKEGTQVDPKAEYITCFGKPISSFD